MTKLTQLQTDKMQPWSGTRIVTSGTPATAARRGLMKIDGLAVTTEQYHLCRLW